MPTWARLGLLLVLGQLQNIRSKPESLKHRCAHSAFAANIW